MALIVGPPSLGEAAVKSPESDNLQVVVLEGWVGDGKVGFDQAAQQQAVGAEPVM